MGGAIPAGCAGIKKKPATCEVAGGVVQESIKGARTKNAWVAEGGENGRGAGRDAVSRR